MRVLIVGKRHFHQKSMCGTIHVLESIVDELKQSDIQYFVYPDKLENKLITYIRLIFVLFKKWDIINVHLDSNYGLVVGLLRFRSNKVYFTVHGDSRIEHPERLYSNITHALQIKYLFKHRIYPSFLMKSKIEENDGILGGSVIYNGIDEKDLDIALHGRHSQNKDIDVFSLCGYGKNKGIDFLLETLRQMPMSFSAVIGGNFRPDNNFVPSEGKVFNSINFYGSMNTADIVDMFLRSKVYVQPSRFESFSIPVLEAMYCGIPPIVSKGAGVFELIEDGVNGFVFNYGDTKKLITSILQIIRGEVDYAQLSKNAKETAKQHLQKHMAKEYLNLFRKAVMN